MARTANPTESDTLRLTLSVQSVELLNALARLGIYGRNSVEVAARFVDERLREFTDKPVLRIKERDPE
jgi:hypothetical protein